MATVRNTLSLQDQTTPVLRKVMTAMESTLKIMAKMDTVSDGAFQGVQKDIDAARKEIGNFNNQIDTIPTGVTRAANSFSKFKNPLVTISAGIYAIKAAFQTITGLTNWSDEISLTKARLDLMNDGLQTTAELQQRIMDSANRSRGAYTDMASSVAKLGIMAGDAFKSNDEIIAFTELMSKSFKVGGAGMVEQKSAMYQLTQAMASGKLQGDEFRSIMENAPMLAAAIAKYTGKTKGELKTMSAEGTITADIIKGAMFAAADDINSKFATMPRTFADVGTLIKNQMTGAFQFVLLKLNSLINSVQFDKFLQGFVKLIADIAGVALWFFNVMVAAGAWLTANWSLIEPVMYGVAFAVAAYNVAGAIAAFLTWQVAAAANAAAIAKAIEAGATWAAVAAQWGLNAAIYAFPGTWIIVAIVAIIAVLIAFGVWLYNLWKKNLDFKYGVLAIWEDLKYGIAGVFSVIQLMGVGVANGIEAVMAAIVVSIQNSINSVIGLINDVIKMSNILLGTKTKLMDKLTFGDTYKAQTLGYAAERNAAVNKKIQTDAQNHVAAEATLAAKKAAELAKIAAKAAAKPPTVPKGFDAGEYTLKGGKLDSVGKIDSAVNISEEDIKMLKDIAAVEFINKYTTLRPELNVSFGDVRETADVNQILDAIEGLVADAYASTLVTG